jgi:predicted nucleic acid-binding protein
MRCVVIDANLLLLLVVGKADVGLIKKHSRLAKYKKTHFDFLINFLIQFEKYIVTPHSLTEMWNLIGERQRGRDDDFDRVFRAAKHVVANILEVYEPSIKLIDNPKVAWLGLSDVAQIEAAVANGATLVSSDGPLCHEARLQNVSAINFWQATEGI